MSTTTPAPAPESGATPSLGARAWDTAQAQAAAAGGGMAEALTLLDTATVQEVLDGLGEVLIVDDDDRILVAESLRRIIATPPSAASWGVLADLTPRVSTEYERNLLATAWQHLARHACEAAADVREGINPVIDPQTGPDQALTDRWEVQDYYHTGDVAALVSRGPGPDTIAHLAGLDLFALPYQARVDALRGWQAAGSWVEAQRLEAVAAVASAVGGAAEGRWIEATTRAGRPVARVEPQWATFRPGRDHWVREELAATLGLTSRAAGRLADRAFLIRDALPGLHQGLLSGRLDPPRVDAIIEELRDARSAVIGETLAAITPIAHTLTTTALRKRIRAMLIAMDPDEAAAQRHDAARRETGIRRRRHRHGLATLEITGPAVEIEAAYTRIDTARTSLDTHAQAQAQAHAQAQAQAQAGGVEPDPDSVPTLGQRRLAAFLHLIGFTTPGAVVPGAVVPEADAGRVNQASATGAGGCGVKVNIHVVVDLPTILHLANHPAELLGYGPIDPTLARALAAEGEWNRWVIDPVTGHLLDEGRTRFAGPHLRAYLKARDGTCCTPGCASPAQDADHLPGWAQGTPTAAASMAAMCAYHNRNRQAAGWDAAMLPDTSIAFHTPLGQQPVVPPRTPLLRDLPDILPEDDPPPF